MKVAVISSRFYTRLQKSKIDQSGPLEEPTIPVRNSFRSIFEFSDLSMTMSNSQTNKNSGNIQENPLRV